jgi:heme exporter protein B
LPVGFFAAACSMTPFAVGNGTVENLQVAGPGVMWIALALASLLPMERLFQADLEDGTLDAYAGSGIGMEGIALAKTLAHWIATGIPLALVIAPVLWIMLQGAPEASGLLA